MTGRMITWCGSITPPPGSRRAWSRRPARTHAAGPRAPRVGVRSRPAQQAALLPAADPLRLPPVPGALGVGGPREHNLARPQKLVDPVLPGTRDGHLRQVPEREQI